MRSVSEAFQIPVPETLHPSSELKTQHFSLSWTPSRETHPHSLHTSQSDSGNTPLTPNPLNSPHIPILLPPSSLINKRQIFTRKQPIHILQLQPFSLRKIHIYDRHPSRVQNSKYDISAPANVCDCRRGDLDDGVVEDPICGCGHGGAALTEAEG